MNSKCALEFAGCVALFRTRRVSLSFGLGILQSDVRESGDGNKRVADERPHFAEDASGGSSVFEKKYAGNQTTTTILFLFSIVLLIFYIFRRHFGVEISWND